jgi:PKD repeat protein
VPVHRTGVRIVRRGRIAAVGGRQPGSLGQSLVEFALVLPLLLFLTLIALDFGRIYLGWINLQNMARIAANFAANHPEGWDGTPDSGDVIIQYENQVAADASATNCSLTPATPADPTFSDANGDGDPYGLGDHATVTLTCRFSVITPVISNVVGGSVAVTASSVFPVKTGMSGDMAGVEWSCLKPSAAINADVTSGAAPLTVHLTDASGGGPGDSWKWFVDDGSGTGPIQFASVQDPGDYTFENEGTYVVTLTVTNVCGPSTTDPGTTITVGSVAPPPPQCTVPNFVQPPKSVRRADVPTMWSAAGFTTTVIDGPGHPMGNYWVTYQSLTAGSLVDCGETIVVNG